MAEHANTVAATIQKLEASPDDTEPLLTLDFPKNKVTQ